MRRAQNQCVAPPDDVSAWRDVRQFFLTMAWGALAGVVCGAAAGATYGALFADSVWGLIVIAFYGLTFGFFVSLLLVAVAAAVITTVLAVRHPNRATEDAVKRDLTAVFAVVVGVLNVAGLVAVGVGGHPSSFGQYLPILVPANVAMVPVALMARASITRSWCASSESHAVR